MKAKMTFTTTAILLAVSTLGTSFIYGQSDEEKAAQDKILAILKGGKQEEAPIKENSDKSSQKKDVSVPETKENKKDSSLDPKEKAKEEKLDVKNQKDSVKKEDEEGETKKDEITSGGNEQPGEVKPDKIEEVGKDKAKEEDSSSKAALAEEKSGSMSEEKPDPVVAGAADDPLVLPEKILTKPSAVLYEEPSEAKKSDQYLPAFSIIEILEKKEGWVNVSDKKVKGWIKESDTIPWKHHLVAQFTPPTDRSRTLFFDTKENARKLAELDPKKREEKITEIQKLIEEGKDIPDKSIIACEPEGWAKMDNNFYLLPIIEFEQNLVELEGDISSPLIKVIAVTENTKTVDSKTLSDATEMTMDIVFVMDLSKSMGPFKDKVLENITKIAEILENSKSLAPDSVRFGLWGYRDDTKACPGIEYVTKNYTSDGLLSPQDFIKVLDGAEATKADSVDYAEDMLAGVYDAVKDTKWREGSAKTIILIGDAPGREPGETDPHSARKDKPVGTASNLKIEEIVERANGKNIDIATAYINVEKYAEHLPIAKKQFEGLASKTEEIAATILPSNDIDKFKDFSHEFSTMILAQIQQARQGKAVIEGVTQGQKLGTALFKNAKVRWLSKHHNVGITSDMSGWVIDSDLINPVMSTIKPCVLLNRPQLDSLKQILQDVVNAGETAMELSTDFMKALQTVVIAGSRDPKLLDNIENLADSRFIPAFLKELPYKSKIMRLNNGHWTSMSASEQDGIINSAKSKLQFYEELYKDGDVWMPLDESHDKSLNVTPVPLEMLP